jgi:hypothetical protein
MDAAGATAWDEVAAMRLGSFVERGRDWNQDDLVDGRVGRAFLYGETVKREKGAIESERRDGSRGSGRRSPKGRKAIVTLCVPTCLVTKAA